MLELDPRLPDLLRPLANGATAARTAFVLDYLDKKAFSEAGSRPTDKIVRAFIADALSLYGGNIDVEASEEVSLPPESIVYNRLKKSGWLTEHQADNFRQVVGLSIGGREVLTFIRRFTTKRRDLSSHVLTIHQLLDGLVGSQADTFITADKIRENASTLLNAAEHADTMRQHFHTVWELYREGEARFVREADPRIAYADYYGKHVTQFIEDWLTINTSQSPMRFEAPILRMLGEIDYARGGLKREYIVDGIARHGRLSGEIDPAQREEAEVRVQGAINTIRNAFEEAKLLLADINRTNLRLGRRVNARHDYLCSASTNFMKEIRDLVGVLSRPEFDRFVGEDATIPGPFAAVSRHYDPGSLKRPEVTEKHVTTTIIDDEPMSEETIARRRAFEIFMTLGHSTPQRMLSLLFRNGWGAGGPIRINDIVPANVADLMDLAAFIGLSPEMRRGLRDLGIEIKFGDQTIVGRFFTTSEVIAFPLQSKSD